MQGVSAKQFFGNQIPAVVAVQKLFGELFHRKQLSGIILIRFETNSWNQNYFLS